MPLFSVIVPVYNAETTIERCVKSIYNSGKDLVEILLVDDGSKDNSAMKCEELSQQYEQVKFLKNEKNKGVSYTRNRGIDNSSGAYLLFVDSDDYVEEHYVSAFLEEIQNGIPFAVCAYYKNDEKYEGQCSIFAWDEKEEKQTYKIKDVIKQLMDKGLMQSSCNKFFETKAVKEKKIYFDERIKIGEDTRFVLEYIQKNNIQEISCINRPLYHYTRDNLDSAMYKVGKDSLEEPIKNMRMVYQIMDKGETEIEKLLITDRKNVIATYAYWIMHNPRMKQKEKKECIYALSKENGRMLYKTSKRVYIKERIVRVLKKLGLRK